MGFTSMAFGFSHTKVPLFSFTSNIKRLVFPQSFFINNYIDSPFLFLYYNQTLLLCILDCSLFNFFFCIFSIISKEKFSTPYFMDIIYFFVGVSANTSFLCVVFIYSLHQHTPIAHPIM